MKAAWIIFSLIFVLGLSITVARRGEKQVQLSPIQVMNLGDSSSVLLPEAGEPGIYFFWATWCGPCKIEMRRMRQAVQEGKLRGDRVFAINMGEERSKVLEFVLSDDWPFRFFLDPDDSAKRQYLIDLTPTVFHVGGDGQVIWRASGLKTDSIARAEALLGRR